MKYEAAIQNLQGSSVVPKPQNLTVTPDPPYCYTPNYTEPSKELLPF